MWNRILNIFVVAALAGAVCLAQGDQKAPPKFFRLDFVLKEVDGGKVVNARSYSMCAGTGAPGSSIRTVVKVNEGNAEHPNWADIGVKIDVRQMHEMQNELALNLTTEIDGLPQDSVDPARTVMRAYTWNSDVLIPVKKPTIVFSSDSTTSKNQMQVEVTATPVP